MTAQPLTNEWQEAEAKLDILFPPSIGVLWYRAGHQIPVRGVCPVCTLKVGTFSGNKCGKGASCEEWVAWRKVQGTKMSKKVSVAEVLISQDIIPSNCYRCERCSKIRNEDSQTMFDGRCPDCQTPDEKSICRKWEAATRRRSVYPD